MIRPDDSRLDGQILAIIAVNGGTAWFISGTLGVSRETVSRRLQSMKRRGWVKTDRGSSYWVRLKPLVAA